MSNLYQVHNQQIRKAKDCENTPLVQWETRMIANFRVEGTSLALLKNKQTKKTNKQIEGRGA